MSVAPVGNPAIVVHTGRVPRPRLSSGKEADLHPVTLVFTDPELEAAFRADFARRNLINLRVAHVMGLVLWPLWGLLIHRYLTGYRGVDLAVRYGVLVPLTIVGLGLTFTRIYRRVWEAEAVAVLGLTAATWTTYAAAVKSMPVDFGYVGLILILAFGYTLMRLRFVLVSSVSAVMVLYYLALAFIMHRPDGVHLVLAAFYLLSFWLLGGFASYTLERSTRLLFLRERQLDGERRRADSLLLNILPAAIVDRLKRRHEGDGSRVAKRFDEVTVVFADAEGFTSQAAKTPADELVQALDDLFTRFDELAGRFGLEKIKTVGDAYMAASGVPEPQPDHAAAAVEMALAIPEAIEGCCWPSGDPVRLRVGLASGPVVAGVIGQKKFAYDLWGDTVNLASRLQTHSEPGRVLVSEGVVHRLGGRYAFGPPLMIDLKGKGLTPACFLVERKEPEDGSTTAESGTLVQLTE